MIIYTCQNTAAQNVWGRLEMSLFLKHTSPPFILTDDKFSKLQSVIDGAINYESFIIFIGVYS